MEDIIGVEIQTADKRSYGFITWGRTFDTVDPDKLFTVLIASYLKRKKGFVIT